jgi:hypothetical protein
MRDFLAYAQFDEFWARFLPETPFGREAREAMTVRSDPAELAQIWDETDAALGWLETLDSDGVRLHRIQHHLKRLPRFCEIPKPVYGEVEIFQFKKFLHNYKSLVDLLDPETRHSFGFSYASEALEHLLDTGRQSAESFYVSDAYSGVLAGIRGEILETDTAIRALQVHRAAEIQTRWGFDFGSRAFLLVPRESLGHLEDASDLLLVEPFDETKYAIRTRASVAELVLQERRAALLSRERSAEDEVLEMLSHHLRDELASFAAYREAVTRFDLAFARARMARVYRLVRPTLGSDAIEIRGGRFLPCEAACLELGTAYVPLDAIFDGRATVIFGSNMGGKTVVLKTLAFLQLCAQMGFFVPADIFLTRAFHHFHYLGEGQATRVAQGLSGFAFEIRQFVEAARDFEAPTLVIFDEFARTTHSLEAEAILSAVLEAVAACPGVVALFSTHFRGVQRFSGVGYLRMQGLNHVGLNLELASDTELAARIRLIDRRMNYHLVVDENGSGVSDAIAVAGLLGLDPAIIRRASDFFRDGS